MASFSLNNQHLFVYHNRDMLLQEICETLYTCLHPMTFFVKRNISLHVWKENIQQWIHITPHQRVVTIYFCHPLSVGDGSTYYESSPLYDDEVVRNMFIVVSCYHSLCSVELYPKLEDIPDEPYHQPNHSSEGHYSYQPNCSPNLTFTQT